MNRRGMLFVDTTKDSMLFRYKRILFMVEYFKG